MAQKIFYSWQSDLPNATNRGFILRALGDASAAIGKDLSVDERPEVDRDTQGVPGAPDIAQTIFEKIDTAQAFVADVSIVTTAEESRPSPNPNVLIELGYAVRAMGWGRIILLMNEAFGGPELLPFDLKTKRVTVYHSPQVDSERTNERKKLQAVLQIGLKSILENSVNTTPSMEIKPVSLSVLARDSIAGGKPDAASAVRRFMRSFADQIEGLVPDGSVAPRDDALVQAIDRTVPLLTEFGGVVESIASHDAREAGKALFKGFEHILAAYDLKPGVSGMIREGDFDLPKFVGHEALVMYVACLIREARWSLLGEVLSEELIVDRGQGPAARRFERISQVVALLGRRKARLQLDRVSVHADILKARHEKGELSQIVGFKEFLEADFFLFLRGWLEDGHESAPLHWTPWSAAYLENADAPRYLVVAARIAEAKHLASALGVSDVLQLRDRLITLKSQLPKILGQGGMFWDGPLYQFDPGVIATR